MIEYTKCFTYKTGHFLFFGSFYCYILECEKEKGTTKTLLRTFAKIPLKLHRGTEEESYKSQRISRRLDSKTIGKKCS